MPVADWTAPAGFVDPVDNPDIPFVVAYDPSHPDPVPPAERLAREPAVVQVNPHPHFAPRLVKARSSYPCAVPGINLDQWTSPSARGWGQSCHVPLATVTLNGGAHVTVHTGLAELVGLIMRANEAQGYVYRAADTGGYNCRNIAGTTDTSWHAWGIAIDCDWTTNPSKPCPIVTDRPGWEIQRWNRYGFGWGGDYDCSNPPDTMHVEFHGTPEQAQAALDLARAEIGTPVLPAAKASPITGNLEVPGVDFSYSKPDGGLLAGGGFTFLLGYVSNYAPKNLTKAQVDAYRAAGLAVGLVWEDGAGKALQGGAAGAADGAAAEAQANALGYPTDCVIFFAVDQDTDASAYPAIQAYAEQFNLNTNRPVGIYGEADVVDHFVTPGQQPVQYGWQTAGWSGGRISAKANLYQRVGHPGWPVPAGVSSQAFDEDVALYPVPLMGWGRGVGPTPPPPPPPAPAPTPGPWHDIPMGGVTDLYAQGPQVAADQHDLIDSGFPVGASGADGFAGPDTVAAIKAAQFALKVPVDGAMGPQTRDAIHHIPSYGLAGNDVWGPITGPDWQHGGINAFEKQHVAALQGQLIRKGCVPGHTDPATTTWDDGVYGSPTTAAVRTFQQREGITVDGLCGATTWTRLFL